MKDTRKFTKQADELMKSGKRIILRMQLYNGNIAERILTPVKTSPNEQYQLYSNVKNLYEWKNKSSTTEVDLKNLDFSKLRRIGKGTLQPSTSKRGMVSSLIEVLLVSGYNVCS